MKLIDSHVHLDDSRLSEILPSVIQRACCVGITAMLVPSVSRASWTGTRAVCATCPQAYAAYGLHPFFLHQHQRQDLDLLQQWIRRETPIAVGECGLDYRRKDLDRAIQLEYFTAQLEIAKDHDLPVIIHATHAVEEVTNQIRSAGLNRGVIHSFNGSLQQAHRLIDMGFLLGFGGAITYERATRIRRLVKSLPLEALLLETDAPDQPPQAHPGEINEPAWLVQVLASMSMIRNERSDHIAAVTTENAVRLFKLQQ